MDDKSREQRVICLREFVFNHNQLAREQNMIIMDENSMSMDELLNKFW